jgi:hypothetical protein
MLWPRCRLPVVVILTGDNAAAKAWPCPLVPAIQLPGAGIAQFTNPCNPAGPLTSRMVVSRRAHSYRLLRAWRTAAISLDSGPLPVPQSGVPSRRTQLLQPRRAGVGWKGRR